jgi:hypothetical protein
MPPQPPSTVNNKLQVKGKGTVLVPEPQFWQRYSPHHEFPLSTATSLAIYALAGALIFFLGRYLVNLGQDASPVPVEAIDVDAGGSGNPDGDGRDPADKSSSPKEAAEGTELASTRPSNPEKEEDIKKPEEDPLSLPEVKDASERVIGESSSAVAGLDELQKEARTKLWEGLKASSEGGRGNKGTGSDTGKGKGNGPGIGDGDGPGRGGNLNVRQKRVLRWQIDFRVRDVQDHLRQFASLGAILAVPDPRGGYRVFRDLDRRPYAGSIEDLSKINRIWFIDTLKEHPVSVGELSRELGIRPPAPHIVAFFPQKLEEQMKRDEEQYRGKKEDEISVQEKIVFQVRPGPGGNYEVVVSPNQY